MRYILLAGALLSGCAGQQYASSCNILATDMGKDQAWLEKCYNDSGVWEDGIYESAQNTAPDDLCKAISINYKKAIGHKLKDIANSRGIECAPDGLNKSYVVPY